MSTVLKDTSINLKPDDEVIRMPESDNFWLDIAPLVLTVIIMGIQFFYYKDFTPHVPLLCGLLITGLFIRIRKGKWMDMENHMYKVVKIGLPASVILLSVGALIASWILAGTVPTILYYGFSWFSPGSFLLSVCILCAIVSVATGTSWGTVGTVGLAMMGIGEGLGIPAPVTGGAIVSGAFFGDKISPLSDTTNLTPAAAEIDLWTHIKGLLPTTIPAMAIALGIYAYMGIQYADLHGDTTRIELIRQTMQEHYQISFITLIPAAIVIGAAILKFPALPTLLIGTLVACLIAACMQGTGLHPIFQMLMDGYKSTTGVEIVDKLLSKGGIMSMTWVTVLTLFALSFVGALEYYGTLRAIMKKINKLIKSRFGLVAASYGATIGVGATTGDVYTTLTLSGRLMKDKYLEMGYRRTTLTRAIEDCGTLLSPLIPWNMGGSFVAGALGIATLTYAPYAFACWISPLIGLVWAATGYFVPKRPDAAIIVKSFIIQSIQSRYKEQLVVELSKTN
ncbi:Malate-2H(+)/Na(+)-lactate antiporter [Suttonella ornithocola]|uniref:Malate-2H(+)/Na(+)-lactate antiporter n=2 Tax=Suttonella ornithocola TaxID=279832 RepID=A0A380MXX5_9GAMM|nr:Malate-2H(+)/Na(+)-lactate antiporter [Suttonella ornithocola]